MAKIFSRNLWLLAIPLLAFVACKKEYPQCRKDKDCNAELGETCVDKTCQNCKTDEECVDKTPEGEATYTCVEFRCQGADGGDGIDGAGGGEEGDPCTQRTDCYGGLSCKGGACSLCSEDLDCSPVACNLDTGRCAPEGQCEVDDQCAMDEICDGGMCIFSGDVGNNDGGPCGLAAIYFAFDSDAITPKADEELTNLATCMVEQGKQVYLEAHADNRGTEEYNILLTERRGRSVLQFLVDKGVEQGNLQVIAKGSLEASGQDEAGRSQDRRVQFTWPAE